MSGSTLRKEEDASTPSSLCMLRVRMMCLIEDSRRDSHMDSPRDRVLDSSRAQLKLSTLVCKKVLKREYMMGSILDLMKGSKQESELSLETQERSTLT
jgi:hypothetical protein